MSQIPRTLGTAVLGGLGVVLLAVSLRPGPVVATPTGATGDTTHTITVSGSGTVTLTPDVARIGLGITVSKPTVEAARAEAAQVMTAIIAAAKGQGVDAKDIATTSIDLSPQYSSDCVYAPAATSCPKPGTIVGYTMNEQVRVTVRNLDRAGAVIDAATAAGATNVSGISFDVADPDKAAADARNAAIADARAKAEGMAKAAGVAVVGVVSITETSSPTPMPYAYADRAAAGVASTPVSPGTQDVVATVTMIFEIS